MENKDRPQVVMVPWLAMGHLIPFLELSKCLALKGFQISFISTPKNIDKLPKIPPNISSLINLVKIPLPQVDNLPVYAESTFDLPSEKVHYLTKAFDGLQVPMASYLENSLPNWIIYDSAAYWLPPIANKLGIPCAYFCLVNAATIAWNGPPSVLMGITENPRKTLEDILGVPPWVPFPSKVVYRLHEILRLMKNYNQDNNVEDVSPGYRAGSSPQGADVVFIRSCTEFESDWLQLIEENILQKPVVPVGLLPPSSVRSDDDNDNGETWREISEWLDKQKKESVVYVSIGTEATPTEEEVVELALGLELSQLPFFWVIRNPKCLTGDDSFKLPDGFEDRISFSGRGYICKGWAPQVRILAHPSVGGFLTHCGWNSIIEALSLGQALIMLPFLGEQGLNARMLEERKVGMEIPRDERDGSFTRDSVAKSLRMVIVDEDGETFRAKAREMRGIFGDKHLHDQYIDKFVQYLKDYKPKET
ncbi:Udp-glycosyltransferase 91c1 [Thalictrum thalictroides]|uniref:Udp-glycosyltransferase 91c1 n=1 Tax=Thalictrum thalictroides TaxID=46969 RepID=A0A7J6UZS1_THATH|nr:Udp-glycosyltransferase 91c1 [Thalictrum thalictroides]